MTQHVAREGLTLVPRVDIVPLCLESYDAAMTHRQVPPQGEHPLLDPAIVPPEAFRQSSDAHRAQSPGVVLKLCRGPGFPDLTLGQQAMEQHVVFIRLTHVIHAHEVNLAEHVRPGSRDC